MRDGMRFRDNAEVALYERLKEKQRALPSTRTLLIIPNACVRVVDHTWEPDFIVVHEGRAGIIEVDGGSHRKKYASDKSRDKLLEDSGISRIDRIDAADAENAVECRRFIDDFLARLTR